MTAYSPKMIRRVKGNRCQLQVALSLLGDNLPYCHESNYKLSETKKGDTFRHRPFVTFKQAIAGLEFQANPCTQAALGQRVAVES
jgi:hypothetical protein